MFEKRIPTIRPGVEFDRDEMVLGQGVAGGVVAEAKISARALVWEMKIGEVRKKVRPSLYSDKSRGSMVKVKWVLKSEMFLVAES